MHPGSPREPYLRGKGGAKEKNAIQTPTRVIGREIKNNLRLRMTWMIDESENLCTRPYKQQKNAKKYS